jgi:hypothetical protein
VKPPYFHDGLEDFVQLVVPILRERGLFPPTTRARRCAIIDAAEVDDQAIRIVGSKDILQAAIDSKQTDIPNPPLIAHLENRLSQTTASTD